MRSAILVGVCLLAATAFLAPAASAESVFVGDCQKFGGLCAGVCVEAEPTCWGKDANVCFGFSYQVPQCV